MLSFHFSLCKTADWARKTFGKINLGDRRRTHRAIRIADAMAKRPGLSIPKLFDSTYEVKATYTFLDRPEVTAERLQKTHRRAVAKQIKTPGQVFLLIEDTSEQSWSGHEPIQGLGPIGEGRKGMQGFLLHSTIAVRWSPPLAGQSKRPPVEVIGLRDQIFHVRTPRRNPKDKSDYRERKSRAYESDLWVQAGEHLGAAPAGVRWERICDRGADMYEFLVQCQTLGQGFIVRAAQDRVLVNAEGHAQGHLFETARQAPVLGHFEVELRARPGQKARVARLAVAAASVALRSPQRPGHGPGKAAPVECTVVRVFEPEPPPGVKPLEWILVTDAEVPTFEAAREVALKYSARWLIEEFHKALKTGLGAERLQLETAHRLFAAIAIMSLVALRLVSLREAVRITPEAPAETAGLGELELNILRARLKRPIRTVRELALAIGRLGGHMNRNSDGLPGWQTLWVGMNQLRVLVQGYLLAHSHSRFGV